MDKNRLQALLESVAAGKMSTDEALQRLEVLPYCELDFAKLDLHRHLRQGLPEVVFCPGKTAEQVIKIAQELKSHHDLFIASRAEQELADTVLAFDHDASYIPEARMLVWGQIPPAGSDSPLVAIVTAGTADISVAEEAAMLLKVVGVRVNKIYDVGVAGLQRLLSQVEPIRQAEVVIAVAGMDAALPSVLAGLVKVPIIGVPTSIGYGASFQGVAALLAMLNSCAAGLSVVNIDNGFGAAVAAWRIVCALKPIIQEQTKRAT